MDIKKQDPLWLKFLRQFTDLMVIVLIVAAFIAIAVAVIEDKPEELTDAYIILGIVFLNAIIGFVQEFKAEKALEALQSLIAPKARVLRDNQELMIEAKDLVPGDIMILAEGDKIGADAQLFEANELKVEQSALTGESVPAQKSADPETETRRKKHDAHNMVYMGTAVASGSGKAVVISTGMHTTFGKIAHMTVTTKKDKSPLQKELHKIGIFVGKITLAVSVALFFVGIFLQGYSYVESLLFSVAVAVAAVPEGLPATITIALALGVQRLAQKNAIIKQLSSVETLGSTTVICSDKTGTLTRNEMTVTQILLGSNHEIKLEGIGYAPKGDIIFPENYDQKDFEKLLTIGAVCNEAKLIREGKKWKMLGDPTEGSLLVAARKGGLDLEKSVYKKIKTFPFDSVRKRMSVVVEHLPQPLLGKEGRSAPPLSKGRLGGVELFAKGAPDSILKLCTHVRENGKVVKSTKEIKKIIEAQYSKMAGNALRVLAIAYRPVENKSVSH